MKRRRKAILKKNSRGVGNGIKKIYKINFKKDKQKRVFEIPGDTTITRQRKQNEKENIMVFESIGKNC